MGLATTINMNMSGIQKVSMFSLVLIGTWPFLPPETLQTQVVLVWQSLWQPWLA